MIIIFIIIVVIVLFFLRVREDVGIRDIFASGGEKQFIVMVSVKPCLAELQKHLENAFSKFVTLGTLPEAIDLGGGRTVEFDYEECDDDCFDGPLLRDPQGRGIQVHERLNGKPYDVNCDDPSSVDFQESWIVWQYELNGKDVALQIASDFNL